MSSASEIDLIQNEALGALVLWAFVGAFFDRTEKVRGPRLAEIMVVLPATLNQQFVESTHSRNFSGGLSRAYLDNKTFALGLQERMESLSQTTLKSLNLAFGANLLRYSSAVDQISPGPLRKVEFPTSDEISKMLASAKRLGTWTADLSFSELNALLNLRY